MHSQIVKYLIVIIILVSSCSKTNKKHLFILSGQSNMELLNPYESFIPKLEEKIGQNKIIVIKDAKGGHPIRRWYKKWNEKNFKKTNDSIGDLYNRLITKVKKTIVNEKIESISFIWMQGERDAREKLAQYYQQSLIGLYNQLSEDLNNKKINFVIGRINDFDLENINYKQWTKIREIQVRVARSKNQFDWVNTDDLNDGFNKKGESIKNDLHMSVKGYEKLGERFAEKALELITNNK